ncbi:exosome 3'-_5 exonuclease subunit ski4 (Csl4) [Elasticomyces elasticus]|uniref:Exosome 3'->5 exonuclease subunit ski4 (Csl4) n=1 Tax=Exophiala sideris TaxID=1016849 RepID=A0ABR0J283_9EURO|nr:exosome 3'->5 exonuclease subunit ski4 (Csl4) [Elasticomyces elasticus]KAK5024715.1 exosome 3'->5 exonuclease subunit ski4 (Csl4) [Exophiala sideris]KAK5030808.1 exosome 3'->5 exonuclease subunit ski4 (Csl4) [Exophiala sideris]KAK5054350.1 exosome 3'->5 exonuclease subunit ski4 (Csl4) [Exophiala sideris]KAK5179750.1 exosome 3'->5 exonuclease subunit ski4 (Csl4) [Eurotiomycetes sp. CCFEE 6388]
MTSSLVTPGQILANTSTHTPGPGTHVYETNILASIIGTSILTKTSGNNKPTISIPRQTPSNEPSTSGSLPKVSSTVLVRVTRVQQRQLAASILLVDPRPEDVLSYTQTTNDDLQFQAVLRREDVRTHEKDKVVMNDMYRVGDIVRATVISLGDERNYYISTAGNDFGVVVATSDTGNAMVPASWKEMRDVVTGQAESRKVAKPS